MKQPKQTVDKVFSPHHQRVLSVAVSIILQFSLYALVLFRFSRYFVYFYWTLLCHQLARGPVHLHPEDETGL